MNREQKKTSVLEVAELFKKAEGAFVINYKGLPVALLQTLRKRLFESGSNLKVTKARLMKIAFKEFKGTEDFSKHFKDQVGLIFIPKDLTVVAKKIVKFAQENPALTIVSGYFESRVLTREDITTLALLPSRDVLIAQLAGTLQAPMACLARALNLVLEQRTAV
jgi:large subunit ribosomal protein L10